MDEQLKKTLDDTPFMRACRRQPAPYTPVWLLRQAGRYMADYRELRSRVSFLQLCKKPELAAEVTVTAARRIGADAAIIFSDILLVLEAMGMSLEFTKGDGPVLHDPIRSAADVERLREVMPEESLGYVLEAIRWTRADLPATMPLIGFSGAPFTLAAYAIEGGSSKNFEHTKRFMFTQPEAWKALMGKLARSVGRYLAAQVASGAQAVQLFDSWAGCLSPQDYRESVMPWSALALAEIPPGVPKIHFGVGTATLLESFKDAGGDIIGLDFHVELKNAWSRLGGVAVQGNLDPAVLLGPRELIRARVVRILEQAAGRPGHIFNLGHGVLPSTPVDNAVALIDFVHELSRR